MTFHRFTCYRSYLAPEIPCGDWRGRAAVTFNLNILEHGFWRNYVHTEGTNAKVETVGWKYELGVKLPLGLELGLSHHSEHRMDAGVPRLHDSGGNYLGVDKFPLEDSVFLRFKFFERK